MSSYVLAIGTRKGLFIETSQDRRAWSIERAPLAGDEVYAVGIDTRRATPRLLASSVSNHWGPSVSHSDDLGKSWQEPEHAPVRYPEWTGSALKRVWQLQPGRDSEPDVVWAGAEPGALFRSEDGGVSFELIDGLWNHPQRAKWTPGGGGLCLHTVLPHPTDPQRMTVAVSTGGVYQSTDGGASWSPSNRGIRADFRPGPEPEFGQCVHKVAMHPGTPDQRRTTVASTAPTMVVGSGSRSPTACPPTSASRWWRTRTGRARSTCSRSPVTSTADRPRSAPGSTAPRTRGSVGGHCRAGCRRRDSTRPCSATRCAPTAARRPGSTSAPGRARCSPARMRASPGTSWPGTCPTC